jgi:hypothetical protein
MAESNPTVTFVKQEEEQPSGGWNRPTTPLPPTVYDPHDDMHWSFCRDPYCTMHLDAKQNNNYFPGAGPANQGQQHLNQPCNRGIEHDPELDAVIKAKHFNIRRPVGPGEGANGSVMTADFWSIRMAMRNDVVPPTIHDPPHQMSEGMRHLPPLARTGTTIMNNTSRGAMRRQPRDGGRCFTPNTNYQTYWSQPLLFQRVSQSTSLSTSR